MPPRRDSGTGGRLAFCGRPAEALAYFRVARLGDVYGRLAEKPPEQWRREFEQCPAYREYVSGRLPAADTLAQPPPRIPRRAADIAREAVRQVLILNRRHAAILRGDRRPVLVMAGQCLLVATLLVLVFGDLGAMRNVFEHARRSVMLLFLLEIACLWFGCNNAAKEFVKERAIYRRERDFNLLVGAYYASKFIVLSALSGAQATLLFLLVAVACRPPGPGLAVWIFLLAAAMTGVAIGLALSTASATEDVAVTLTPVVLIPQVILAGVVRANGQDSQTSTGADGTDEGRSRREHGRRA